MRTTALALVMVVLVAACTSSGDDGSGPDDADSSDVTGFVDARASATRQDEYLEVATADFDPSSPLNVLAHAERAEREPGYSFPVDEVTPEALADLFTDIDGFVDTTDFDMLYLVNLWQGYRDQLPSETVAAIEDRFLAFKYWFTEPTPEGVVDDKYYWSENHRIIFHTIEYLNGQAFPDETFTNDGRSGAEHRDEARERILEWLDEKVRFGWTEWHSDVYYQKDITPLLTLVEWADDPEVAERAAMVLDLVLFDLAAHLQQGNFGATHGRSYMKDKSRALDQDTFALAKLLFDDTERPYNEGTDAGAVLLARAGEYRLPEVIRRVARSDETSIDRQHMGVPLDISAPVEPDPEAPFGYDFDDPDNVTFWWERGAQTAWQVVPLTIDTLDTHDLWESQFYAPFLPLRDLVGDDDDAARDLAQSLSSSLGFALLSEVDTYTYRSPEVMLSTAQDYRPGVFGDQYHVWQATLDEDALVFTTQPTQDAEPGDSWPDSDGYWTGTGSTPRSTQQGAAAIHQYDPQFVPGPPLNLGYIDETHAYFPQEHFDEVVQDQGWTLGRKGDGYVALWSMRPAEFRPLPAGVYTGTLQEDFDLVATGGPDNVWVVEVGDAAQWGTFDEFREAVTGARVEATPADEGFDVVYESPAEGVLEVGWEGPLSVDGEPVDLHPQARFDNPWVQADFGATRYEISEGDATLVLDFDALTREVANEPG